jgi:hypothetical protein
LVAAFSNLFPQSLERDVFSEMPEGVVPRQNVELVGIDESPVEIENRTANHESDSAFSSSSASGSGGGFAATAAGR